MWDIGIYYISLLTIVTNNNKKSGREGGGGNDNPDTTLLKATITFILNVNAIIKAIIATYEALKTIAKF